MGAVRGPDNRVRLDAACSGTIRGWLVEQSQTVGKAEAILLAITGKIFYMEAPVAGTIQFNKQPKENPTQIAADPYGQGWLFFIEPSGSLDSAYQSLAFPEAYLDALRISEGGKNPEGIKGGVSGNGSNEQSKDTFDEVEIFSISDDFFFEKAAGKNCFRI